MPVPDSMPMTPDQRKAAAALLAKVSSAADDLGRLFARHGHELALVGGPVRDVFLRRQPGDFDLTTDAPPERVLEITGGWADKIWTIGIDFGTVGLRKGSTTFEVTTYRSEEYSPGSRKPGVRYGTSLEEDLFRRDFTINAMAARLPSHEFVDPFGSLRAARFAAQLGFAVVPEVRGAMREQAGRLEIVSAERITGELTKLMLAADPVRGIELLVDTGVADEV